jgi:iron-sulfur cluster assembly protein
MATARLRPQVMRLSDAAAARIKDIMATADRPFAGVRVGVRTAAAPACLHHGIREKVNPTDEVIEEKGITLMIDPKAVMFLIGTEMDYKSEKLSAQFVFNNPNQTSACGCGESVLLTPAGDESADAR